MPLLDLLEIGIGLSVLCIALACISQAFVLGLKGMDTIWSVSDLSPGWLWDAVVGEAGSTDSSFPVGPAFIMLASWLLSIIVYRIEIALARIHSWSEYESDALELLGDSMIELTTGAGILISATCVWYFEEGSGIRVGILNFATPVMLLYLAYYLAKHALEALSEGGHKLLNPALDDDLVSNLVTHLNRGLPEGCTLAGRADGRLKAWWRGDTTHIVGELDIVDACWASADTIVDDCVRSIETYLRVLDADRRVDARILPRHLVCSNGILSEVHAWLDRVAHVSPDSQVGVEFMRSRTGAREALGAGGLEYPADDVDLRTHLVSLWVRGCSEMDLSGPASEEVIRIESLGLEARDNEQADTIALFDSWVLIRQMRLSPGLRDEDIATSMRESLEAIDQARSAPVEIRAEACFALGFYWERCSDSDIDRSAEYYRRALALYLAGCSPSERDRLLNTWGHQRSLQFEVSASNDLLRRSEEIKRQRGDLLGLTYSIGCQADNRVREGMFAEALVLYGQNLDYLSALGSQHLVPYVKIKRAECLMRQGFLQSEAAFLSSASLSCTEVLGNARLAPSEEFFARKCLVKTALAQWLLLPKDVSGDQLLDAAESILGQMRAVSNYENALLARLCGRHAMARGDARAAVEHLGKSADGFDALVSDAGREAGSIQSALCRFEASECEVQPTSLHNAVGTDSLEELRVLVCELAGTIGGARARLEKYFSNWSSSENSVERHLAAYRIIYFLEL
jgi:hypothetical protein